MNEMKLQIELDDRNYKNTEGFIIDPVVTISSGYYHCTGRREGFEQTVVFLIHVAIGIHTYMQNLLIF